MTELKDYHVVLIGSGNMGSALVRGAIASGALHPSSLIVVDTDIEKAAGLATELGCGGGDTISGSTEPTLFILATKPKDIEPVIRSLPLKPSDIIVSVAAGVTSSALKNCVSDGVIVIRTMPNTPVTVGAGVTALFNPDGEIPKAATQFFESVGLVVTLKNEAQFDAVTGLSGSGPAYIFVAIEAMADGGVAAGLDRITALKLATQTVIGAGKLVQESGRHPGELKDAVASPGGTTIAALTALENAGFRSALIEAVNVAAKRSAEMSK